MDLEETVCELALGDLRHDGPYCTSRDVPRSNVTPFSGMRIPVSTRRTGQILRGNGRIGNA
jgi:hypothetical protein